MVEARSHSSVVSCSPSQTDMAHQHGVWLLSQLFHKMFDRVTANGLQGECLSDLVEGHNHERDEQRAAQGHLGFGASTGYTRAHNL